MKKLLSYAAAFLSAAAIITFTIIQLKRRTNYYA